MAGFGWRGALLLLMVFPLLAPSSAGCRSPGAGRRRRPAQALCITGDLAVGAGPAGDAVRHHSLVYYVIIGWLPSILQSMGYSEARAGSLHGLLQLGDRRARPGDTADPASAARPARDRGAGRLMCAISAAGRGCCLSWRSAGRCCSALAPSHHILGLTFIGLRQLGASGRGAVRMAQSVGYLLAACGPPLMGRIHDANGDWHSAAGGGADFAGDGGLRRARRTTGNSPLR